MTSEVSRRAAALVEARRPEARVLGAHLSDLVDEPEAFVSALRAGLRELSDAAYAAAQAHVAPGGAIAIGTRWPLIHEVERVLRAPLAEAPSDWVLALARHLAAAPEREVRLFALPCLARTLATDPERSWQLLRQLAHGAPDWIAVDAIAEVAAQGVLLERFRWAELELLAYSDRPMERRLVGATLARVPHRLPPDRRLALPVEPTLALIGQLMGDAHDQVQKALSWALREWGRVHPLAVGTWLDDQSVLAAATGDGHRAWVVRDGLGTQPPDVAGPIVARLAGLRRRPDSPSTSRAAAIAHEFGLGALAGAAVAQQGERYSGRGT